MTPEEIEQQAKEFIERKVGEAIEVFPEKFPKDEVYEYMADFALHYHNQQKPEVGQYWSLISATDSFRLEKLLEDSFLARYSDGTVFYFRKNYHLYRPATHAEITQYWKDRIAAALPSDDEIEEVSPRFYNIHFHQAVWQEGAEWMRDKLKDL